MGAHAYIECPVYNDETDMLFFEWSRGTDEPIEETNRIRINDRGVLKIKSATVEDSGLYYCKAINGFGSVTTSVELKIVPEEDLRGLSSPLDNQYPIQFPLNDNILSESEVSSDFSYMKTIIHPIVSGSEATLLRKPVGVSVVLRCGAKSKVEWTKNGRHLSLRHLPDGSSKRKGVLILSKVRMEDSGNYSCVGTDESSGRVNKTFALIVYGMSSKSVCIIPNERLLYEF